MLFQIGTLGMILQILQKNSSIAFASKPDSTLNSRAKFSICSAMEGKIAACMIPPFDEIENPLYPNRH